MKQINNDHPRHRKKWIISLIVGLPLHLANAFEWRTDTSYGVEIEYTDNLFMVPESARADTYAYANANLRLIGQTDTSRINIDGSLRIQRLNRTKEANEEFYSGGLYYSDVYNWGLFTFASNYNEASIRTTDLETIGSQPIYIFGKRSTTFIQPRIEIDVTETTRLALTAAYAQNRYNLEILTDYTNYQTGLDWYYIVSDNLEFDIQLLAQRYDSLDNVADYNYGSTLITADISTSEYSQIQVGGGIGYVLRNIEQNYTTFLGIFSASHENEYSRLYFFTETSLQPTSTRGITRLSRINLGYQYTLADNRTISTEINASRSRLVEGFPIYENDVVSFNLAYNTFLSEQLFLGAQYTFINNRSSLDNLDRKSNSMFLALTIEFDEH